jgi:hypothetical protein
MSATSDHTNDIDDDATALLEIITERLATYKTDRTNLSIQTVTAVKKRQLGPLTFTKSLGEESAVGIRHFGCLLLDSGKVGIPTPTEKEYIPFSASEFVALLKNMSDDPAQVHRLLVSAHAVVASL